MNFVLNIFVDAFRRHYRCNVMFRNWQKKVDLLFKNQVYKILQPILMTAPR